MRSALFTFSALLVLGCAATDDDTGKGTGGLGGAGAVGVDAGTGGVAGAGGSAGVDAGGGSAGADAGGSAGAEAGGAGGSTPCPSGKGPTMVSVGGYCIDSTEVTNAQYAEFLDQSPETSGQPAACAFNSSFVPSSSWPNPAQPNRPVVYVDWCDAYAYCLWAGKRLCGKIGGGANAYADVSDPFKSQWMGACSSSGFKKYPYGNVYAPATCNGVDYAAGHALDAGELEGCEGGTPGIFDMSGNVWEWEDSCQTDSGAQDQCRVRGGSYWFNGETDLTCENPNANDRDTKNDIYGFRCCAP